ncbi:hypothetical protein [Fulvimonas yonginensis]|uniref:DUF2868 domain-containing protein n=1 Tax=Fulvimonas yonginensis TaxID=1495200 RepID=A0ABU8J9T0_9GAMM
MNREPRLPDTAGEFDPLEWAAQERALAEERAGLPPVAGEPRLRSYRLMARVLAQPPQEELPADFAWCTAQRAERAAAARRSADARFERNLQLLLVLVFAATGSGALMAYAGAWLPSFDGGAVAGLLARPWLWALAACLGLSRLYDRWWWRNLLG